MKPMIEVLESRMLLSASPTIGVFYPEHVGEFKSSHGLNSGSGTLVIGQKDSQTLNVTFTGQNGTIHRGTGTVVGRRYTFQIRLSPTQFATFSGEMTYPRKLMYSVVAGTYSVSFYGPWMTGFAKQLAPFLGKRLSDPQIDSGTFSAGEPHPV